MSCPQVSYVQSIPDDHRAEMGGGKVGGSYVQCISEGHNAGVG